MSLAIRFPGKGTVSQSGVQPEKTETALSPV